MTEQQKTNQPKADWRPSVEEYVLTLQKGEIPQHPPRYLEPMGKSMNVKTFEYRPYRQQCIKMGLWTVIDQQWTRELSRWIGNRRVLEIMSGMGHLAKALTDHGVRIIATDDKSWDEKLSKNTKVWFDVEPMDCCRAIKKYGDASDILLVCWPPFESDAIVKACHLWGGEKPIIYIGEGESGLNAPDEFFAGFEEIGIGGINMMSWESIHDRVVVGYWRGGK